MNSRTKISTVLIVCATAVVVLSAGGAAWTHLRDHDKRTDTGYDLVRPNSDQPSGAASDHKVVIDYFYYGCPHCRAFESTLETWTRQQGTAVNLKRIPVTGGHAKLTREAALFYALDSLGAIPRVQESVFETITHRTDFPASDQDLVEWAGEEGIDPQRLVAAYHAPNMKARIDAGDDAFRTMGIGIVPAIVVHARRIVTAATAGSIERMPDAMTRALTAESTGS